MNKRQSAACITLDERIYLLVHYHIISWLPLKRKIIFNIYTNKYMKKFEKFYIGNYFCLKNNDE